MATHIFRSVALTCICAFFSIAASPAVARSTFVPTATQQEAFIWTARVLARFRYKPDVPAPAEPVPVMEHYLTTLDPDRSLFTQADIAEWEPLRELIARNDESKQLDTAFTIFERQQARQAARMAWAQDAIQGQLKVIDDGRLETARPAIARPASDAEQQARWRKRVEQDVLELRRAGVDEKNVVALLMQRYERRLAATRASTSADAFDVFMNAYVRAFDPHGVYFPPVSDAKNTQKAAGQVGVGLLLQNRGDIITVLDLVSDGAAFRSGRLQVGDGILAIGQGEDGPMIDVVGWSVGEAMPLLRGAQGSTVVLIVRPGMPTGSSTRKPVVLVRRAISSQVGTGHASATVEVVKHGDSSYRIGVVTVPTFYRDSAAKREGASDYASMTRDVARLLVSMKGEGADAILLDMRGNGGGSLDEAISFTGLFVPRAPVAQQRERDGKITIASTADGVPAWVGPLAVLIDEGSAAATEIFAGALQDYGIGLVIGDRSLGRTSVQTFVSLDRFATRPSVRYGELKMTVSQVFRVSGGTFEQIGVQPDLIIPGVVDPSSSAGMTAFPAMPIRATEFIKRGNIASQVPMLKQRHESRTAKDPSYQALLRVRAGTVGPGVSDVDVRKVQLSEALHVIADEIALSRIQPIQGR